MSRLQKGVIPLAGLALILSLAVWRNARQDAQTARRELLALTTANEFLRKTLADMTVAMATKDREIDRLERRACDGQEKGRRLTPPVKASAGLWEHETGKPNWKQSW